MKPTYKEVFDACVQYYVDRGNTVEAATIIVDRGEAAVFSLYDFIQEEKKLPAVAIEVDLLRKK